MNFLITCAKNLKKYVYILLRMYLKIGKLKACCSSRYMVVKHNSILLKLFVNRSLLLKLLFGFEQKRFVNRNLCSYVNEY